jgi:hypothetical protein
MRSGREFPQFDRTLRKVLVPSDEAIITVAAGDIRH